MATRKIIIAFGCDAEARLRLIIAIAGCLLRAIDAGSDGFEEELAFALLVAFEPGREIALEFGVVDFLAQYSNDCRMQSTVCTLEKLQRMTKSLGERLYFVLKLDCSALSDSNGARFISLKIQLRMQS